MTSWGLLKAYAANLADVQLTGSLNTYLTAIPVNRAIPAGEMIAGRKVIVELLDDGNSQIDAVVTAVWT